MEVPYRNTKLLIKEIPKGTILFRLSKDTQNDLRGVLLDDGTRCLTPNFNVFFHPNPFIGIHLYKDYLEEIGKTVNVYKVLNDIKVLSLVKPSKYSRMSMKNKTFITRCSTVKQGCLPRKGKSYDPCFSKTMIEKYPDIVGMLVLSPGDNKLKKNLKNVNPEILSYFHKAEDSFKINEVPELILHPLSKRPSKDLISNDNDSLDLNYKLLKKIPYNEKNLLDFMTKLKYNPSTYFFEE
jgi:hypothetical protein